MKQKAFCGEGNRHWSECLKNALSSLFLNGEDKFLNKLVNIHVRLLTLWSRLQLFARTTDEKMSHMFFFVVICKIISVHTKRRKIWAWRMWYGRPSRRWMWLLFVLHVFRCVIFLLVTVWIHYDFLYFISIQHTSPFHTWNIATLHFQQNFSTTNASNSKISTERSQIAASYLVV